MKNQIKTVALLAGLTIIMGVLTESELRGVFAHELAHIKNRDILVPIVGVISREQVLRYVGLQLNLGLTQREKQPSPKAA